MNEFLPPGLLSGYKYGGKTIQIQTEYAHRPHRRVTTSVVLDGRTVHKIDTPWEEAADTPAIKEKLESCLNNQHRQALALVKARAEEFVGGPPDPTPAGYPKPSFRDSMVEVLGSLPFVIGIYEFDKQGKILFSHNYRDICAEWAREFETLAGLVSAFPEIIRVGDFRYGCAWSPAENVVLIRLHGRSFGILTDSAGSIETIRGEFPELFEAAYD